MDETIEPITTELREWWSKRFPVMDAALHNEFTCLCDNINAVHAQLERDYATACKINETQDADYVALMRQRDELRDENSWLHAELYGWETEAVKLPLDADGVPIRPGETMRERSGNTFEVACLQLFGGADNWLVLSDARSFSTFREPHDITHVQPDTWERIIEDAIDSCDSGETIAHLVARCRALAGDAE